MSTRLRLLILAVFVLCGTTGMSQSALAGEYGSLEEAMTAASDQNKPLLIDFFTEW